MKRKIFSLILVFALILGLIPIHPRAADLGKPSWEYFYFFADEGLAICQVTKGPDDCKYQFHASAMGKTKDSSPRKYNKNGFSYDVSNYTKYSGVSVDVSMRYVTVDEDNIVVSSGSYSDAISVTMASSSGITAKDIVVPVSASAQTVQVNATTSSGNSLTYACLGSLSVDSSGLVTIPANFSGSDEIIITNIKSGKATTSKRITVTVSGKAAETEHTHNYKLESDTATCGQDGVKTYKCACGESKTESSKATGKHSYDNGVVTKEATTESAGVKTYTCKNCSATKTETIPKLDKPEESTAEPESPTAEPETPPVNDPDSIERPGKVKGLKATNCRSGVKISFNGLDDASAYCIYRKGLKDKKYSRIAVLSDATNYMDTTVKNNGIYYYKVKAVKDGVSGNYCKSVKKRFLKAPKIKSLKSKKNSITISFTKNRKASYYQIRVSTSKNFKSYRTIKTTSMEKTIKKLISRKTTYVKVRAAKSVNGKTMRSAWSARKKIKVK